jgi:Carboxypeptidase regulatory-like domain
LLYTGSQFRRSNGIAALSLLLAISAAPIQAQVLYGSLTGHVVDATGADVPRAKVEALNVATGASKQTVTDDRGTYSINDLQAGTYRVTISKDNQYINPLLCGRARMHSMRATSGR